MPTITLPKITLQLHGQGQGVQAFVQQGGDGAGNGKACAAPLALRTKFDKNRYISAIGPLVYKEGKVEPLPGADTGSQPAPLPPMMETETGTGPGTYYRDPKDMTPAQISKFQRKARLDRMTRTDYTNWLLTFKDSPALLTAFHRGNLRILQHGGTLQESDLPRVTRVPPTGEEYYRALLHGTVDNVPQPEFLGFRPANESSIDLGPVEKSLDHLAFINPDEPLKTWTLTHDRHSP